MDPMQVASLAAAAATGILGTLFAVRRDRREEKTVEEAKQQARDKKLLEDIHAGLSSEIRLFERDIRNFGTIIEATQAAVSLLNSTIENKLATKQELVVLTMRIDSNDARLMVLEKQMHDMELTCAKAHP